MPLDTRKAAHITGKLAKIQLGRTQQITLVLRLANNTTSTITKNAIWRQAEDADPTVEGPSSGVPGGPVAHGTDDIVSLFNQSDITLAQLRSIIYGFPTTPLQAEPANRYTVTSITPKGILPGGTRFIVTWTRQR